MKVLVINCGSSSLKYQLIDMSNEEVKKAYIEQEIHNAKRYIKGYEKSIEICIRNAEIYKEVPAGAYYLKRLETYQNRLRLQKEYLENLQRGAIWIRKNN